MSTSDDLEAVRGDVRREPASMSGGKQLTPYLPDRDDYVVAFAEPYDPLNPQKRATWRKYVGQQVRCGSCTDIFIRFCISFIACSETFVASFNSAIFAAGESQAREEFQVGRVVAALGTSLLVLGFAAGPVIWAPGSGLIGRRWPLCFGLLGTSIFSIGSATSKDIQTLIICRFFAGLFGASPLCVVPAVLADMYNDTYRGMAIQFYALTVFGSPFIVPIVGDYITESHLRWRWTLYLPSVLGLANFLFMLVFLGETFVPMALVDKARRLRRETGNWAIHADQEKVELDFGAIVRKYLTRPLRMLVTEPIVMLVSIYMSFIYGLVYALLEAYP